MLTRREGERLRRRKDERYRRDSHGKGQQLRRVVGVETEERRYVVSTHVVMGRVPLRGKQRSGGEDERGGEEGGRIVERVRVEDSVSRGNWEAGRECRPVSSWNVKCTILK